MQVGHGTPKIYRLSFRQEKGDPGYGSCLWADFYLDPKRGALMIMSDCENAGYRWPETGNDFIQLMESVDEEYLLGKLFKKKAVNIQGTLNDLQEALEESECYSKRQIKRYMEALKDTFEGYYLDDAPDLASYLVTEWCNEYSIDLPDVYEYVNTGYGRGQERIVHIFVEHIQPLIAKAVGGESSE